MVLGLLFLDFVYILKTNYLVSFFITTFELKKKSICHEIRLQRVSAACLIRSQKIFVCVFMLNFTEFILGFGALGLKSLICIADIVLTLKMPMPFQIALQC